MPTMLSQVGHTLFAGIERNHVISNAMTQQNWVSRLASEDD
ncbi:MAG: hypothetical protein Ct9H90mP16_09420 [Candidatus Poseidoniales archaeon]|nr:MAG: hypothetical protein Ct9H90mP16_09420 [Candidatus Poseidoniales archaeon]